MSKCKKIQKRFDSINVIPFIDIMLVLLVMVLTTATFIKQGVIPVALPTAKASTKEDVKKELKSSIIMIAGGREITFGQRQGEIFEAGADSIVIGNYLTTKGQKPIDDLAMIQSLGLEVAKSCDT